MGCRFGTGEGGKNHSMLTKKNLTTPLTQSMFLVKTQEILNRATNRRATMETDAKKKRPMLFILFNGRLHA